MNAERELTIDELDAVSGGVNACKYDTNPLCGVNLLPGWGSGEGGGGGGGGATTPAGAWNACLKVFGYGPQA